MNAILKRQPNATSNRPGRWALESMCCELLQNAETYRLVPLVNLLIRIEHDIVSGAGLTAGHQIVIAGLYRRHVGEWEN